MKRMICILFLCLGQMVNAVEPEEILSDPLLETRARSISQGLRCLQCRNESIDESSADIARDLRILVRERLVAGDSDTEVIDYVVDRFGEFVLLKPNGLGSNLILWLTGPILLLITSLGLYRLQRRSDGGVSPPLSADEEKEIERLLTK